MADLSELLKSKKVSTFVRKEKSRPWTIERTPAADSGQEAPKPVKTELKPGENPVKTELKPGENPVKTELKPGENPVTPKPPKNLKNTKPGENPVNNPVKVFTKPGENPVKTRGEKREHLYISGQDRKVMLALFSLASKDGFKQTPPFSKQTLSKQIPLSYETLRSSLKRLITFDILESVESARGGPSAWTRATFTEDAYRSLYLTRLKPGENPVTDAPQTRLKPGEQPGETLPSSSSFLDIENFKTTTTSEPELFEDGRVNLSPEWSAVDFSPLTEIGFTQTHLVQLAKQVKLSIAEVQASIEFFAFDLRRNGKGKTLHSPPLNFFMGILRKGIPYAPPENFETEADEARRRTREILERKERERQTEEDRLRDLEFAGWRRGLTEAQAVALVPDAVKDIPRAREASLRLHFDEQVYPGLEAARSGEEAAERALVRAAIAQSLGDLSK